MRWSTLLTEPAALDHPEAVFKAGSALIASAPTAKDLYETWERNQWNPQEITFEEDRRDWERIPPPLREKLTRLLQTFVIGEYTGLDLLAPVMAGTTSEDGLHFVGTQVADEAKHSRYMFRLVAALWSDAESERAMLDRAWRELTPSYRRLSEIESSLSRATLARPGDYTTWLRQVSMFHLITEGVLAFYGQQSIVRMLGKTDLFPGIRTGFVAMGRDEARHISFGLEMLRDGVREGQSDEILHTLTEILPYAITVDFLGGPMRRSDLTLALSTRKALTAAAYRRLRQIGLSADVVNDVLRDASLKADLLVSDHDA